MKPSPFFADTFRFFFKRFSNQESLTRWFLKKAGTESSLFSYPTSYRHFKKTLIFLPDNKESTILFLEAFKTFWNKENTLFVAKDSLRETLIHHPVAKTIFLTEKEFRYGELAFNNVEQQIFDFKAELCLYLLPPFLPALYLAKRSLATCRIGFNSNNLFPFLNINLTAENDSEKIAMLKNQYEGSYGC